MRLIDADALMDALGITDMDCKKCAWGHGFYCRRGSDFEDACTAIKHAPTIEPKRKTGKWIEYIPEHGKCPFCGNQVDLLGGKANNFCGECGADMKGKQDDFI